MSPTASLPGSMHGDLGEDVPAMPGPCSPSALNTEAIIAEFVRSDFLRFILARMDGQEPPGAPSDRCFVPSRFLDGCLQDQGPTRSPRQLEMPRSSLRCAAHEEKNEAPKSSAVMLPGSVDDQEVGKCETKANPESSVTSVAFAPGCPLTADDGAISEHSAIGMTPSVNTGQTGKRTSGITTIVQSTLHCLSGRTTRDEAEKRSTYSSQRTAAQSKARLLYGSSMELDQPARKPVFADVEVMKAKVRQAISQPQPSAHSGYKSDGYAVMIATSPNFDYFTLSVIAFNAIWIAVDADLNDQALLTEAHPVFQFAEHSFCLFFLFEILIRLMAYKHKLDSLKDAWFVFDSALVTLMMFETWIMPFVFLVVIGSSGSSADIPGFRLFRMVRLLRIVRITRLVRAMPELVILIKGIRVAARSVFFTLCLLSVIIYIFAVAFRQLTDDIPLGKNLFRSVPYSMKALLLYGTIADMAPFIDDTGDAHIFLGFLALVFVLLSTITIMNMLVGVLVEVVSVVSAVEKEGLKVQFVKSKLVHLLQVTGVVRDDDFVITRNEFATLLLQPEAAKVFQDVGVDPVGLVDHADFIFKDVKGHDKDLSFCDFIEVVLRLRGTNNSTVGDVVDLRKIVMKEVMETKDEVKSMRKMFAVYFSEVRDGTSLDFLARDLYNTGSVSPMEVGPVPLSDECEVQQYSPKRDTIA